MIMSSEARLAGTPREGGEGGWVFERLLTFTMRVCRSRIMKVSPDGTAPWTA